MSDRSSTSPAHGAAFGLDPAFAVGDVDRRLFGSFVEHMGRCVYTGIYEPDHPTADAEGFRQDVLDLTRDLGVSVVRYPGGNFVSSYRWEDGVGPREERPGRLDLAWRGLEPNAVGVNEFMGWARGAGLEPMMAVNLGTRGVEAAVDLIEYCNHPEGTYLSDLRRSHGAKEPHDIRLWCLGNELDGPVADGPEDGLRVRPSRRGDRQGHAHGRPADRAGRRRQLQQPHGHLRRVGGRGPRADLRARRLHLAARLLRAGGRRPRQLPRLVGRHGRASSRRWSRRPTTWGARLRSSKKLKLSFDEWNVWYQKRFVGQQNLDWTFARELIEDEFNVTDAVVVGSFLITLLRHADRVGVACQAQLVNVIAPIRTEAGGAAWRQTIYHPFALTSRLARGRVLRVEARSPQVDTAGSGPWRRWTSWRPTTSRPATSSSSPSTAAPHEPLPVEVDLRALVARHGTYAVTEHHVIADDDLTATNTAEHPDRVVPRAGTDARVEAASARVLLPPVSWSAVRLSPTARLTGGAR